MAKRRASAGMTSREGALQAARDRTDAKLRYAEVHLGELRTDARRGGDFDRAHQESFLFHLFGARDAFLQEINIIRSCDLPLERVTRGSLMRWMNDHGQRCVALERLTATEVDEGSWLSKMKAMRDHSTHRHAVGRNFQMHLGGGELAVFFQDPRTGEIHDKEYMGQFRSWLESMKELIKELRLLVYPTP